MRKSTKIDIHTSDIPTSNVPINNDDVNISNDEHISNDETVLNDTRCARSMSDFRHAFRKEYILPLAARMICNINTHQCDNIEELSFDVSLYRVAKTHNQHKYIRKIQETVNPYIHLFNTLNDNDMKLFCLYQILQIANY